MMKKSYVKPQVYFENFQLSANIAGNCKVIATNQNEMAQCGIGPEENTVFVQGWTGCSDPPLDDSICYHNPADANRLFTS